MVHLVLEQILGHLIHVRVHSIKVTWMDIGNELNLKIVQCVYVSKDQLVPKISTKIHLSYLKVKFILNKIIVFFKVHFHANIFDF